MCKPFQYARNECESSCADSALQHVYEIKCEYYVKCRKQHGGSTTAVVEAVLDNRYRRLRSNPNTRSMRVHGDLVETTYSEFEIMKCFVNNPGRVYSREDLLQTVRGFDSLCN